MQLSWNVGEWRIAAVHFPSFRGKRQHYQSGLNKTRLTKIPLSDKNYTKYILYCIEHVNFYTFPAFKVL